jgi:tetratricopeptide (TPR) repeat protein
MDANSWLEEADELYKDGKFDEAIPFYDKAIEQDPDNSELWNRRGLALCCLGRHLEAIDSFDIALKIDPHYTDAQNNKVVCRNCCNFVVALYLTTITLRPSINTFYPLPTPHLY